MINKQVCAATFFCLLLLSINKTVMASSLLPALTVPATNKVTPGKIIWADILTDDVEKTINFYTIVFGWSVKQFELEKQDYYFLMNNGRPVAGIVPQLATNYHSNKAMWINHVSTADIDKVVIKANELGAKILFSPKQIGNRGINTIISDPNGGVIGILKSDSGDPIDDQAVVGDWVWAQLFSSDLEKSAEFYTSVFGYDIEQATHSNSKGTYMLVSNNKARAGVAPLPKNVSQRNRWVGFVSVNNINDVLLRAKEKGAKIIFSPKQSVFNGRIAIIADPNGALIGVLSTIDFEQ